MQTNRDMLSRLIAEAQEDEIGLWLIIATLRNDLQVTDPALIRSKTLDCVRELLESGEVVAGYYKTDAGGIESWDMPIAKIVSRIDREWDELGHEPNIGDIVVFVGKRRQLHDRVDAR
jgi:hypothetical protein